MADIKNKQMKKGILVAAFIGLLNVGLAQEGPGGQGGPEGPDREKFMSMTPEERAEKRTEKMAEVLDLSDDQKKQIKKINLDHAYAMESIHEEGKALKEKAKKQKDDTRNSIESVLTDEQLKILEEKEEERKKRRAEKCKCCQHK